MWVQSGCALAAAVVQQKSKAQAHVGQLQRQGPGCVRGCGRGLSTLELGAGDPAVYTGGSALEREQHCTEAALALGVRMQLLL